MTKAISKSQIDRAGNRLKIGSYDEGDLDILNQYRLSFAEAYETVVNVIKTGLGLELTGRPKSNVSIIQKLRRESIRLSQIQDIAGCRIIVTDVAKQDALVESLKGLFEEVVIIDRRQQPSHGYRAVHVIVRCQERLIEIQVRTQLQHLWAELSEKTSDVLDQAIKYGEGDEDLQASFMQSSSIISDQDALEVKLVQMRTELLELKTANLAASRLMEIEKLVEKAEEGLHLSRQAMLDNFREALRRIAEIRR